MGSAFQLRLSVDGQTVGRDDLPVTPVSFNIHETVGVDSGAPTASYRIGAPLGYPIEGASIHKVTIRLR